jgi:N-acetylneuraminic acid mutarotase
MPHPRPTLLLLAFLLATLVPLGARAQAPAAPQDKELIAVMDMEGVGTSDVEKQAITDRLREVLLKTGRFTVVDRSQMETILDEQALQQTGCTGESCAVQVGQILGVRKIVAGKIVKFSDTLWQISALMLDVETAETLRADSVRHQGDIFSLLDNQVTLLGQKLASAKGGVLPASLGVGAPKPMGLTKFVGEWTQMAPLTTGRSEHAAAALNDRVYVFGGLGPDKQPMASVEAYNAQKNAWEELPPLPEARSAATAAAFNGRLYVIGGRKGEQVLERVDIYDPAGRVWTPGPKLPTARGGALAVADAGKLYVIGGVDKEEEFLDDVLVLNAAVDGWDKVAHLLNGRAFATAEVLDGRIYVVGGEGKSKGISLFAADISLKYAEVFDPVNNRWRNLAKMPKARSYISSAVIQGNIYVFGGYLGNVINVSAFGSYYIYDPTKDQWSEGGSMDRVRAGHTSTIANGRVYFIGGRPDTLRMVSELR